MTEEHSCQSFSSECLDRLDFSLKRSILPVLTDQQALITRFEGIFNRL